MMHEEIIKEINSRMAPELEYLSKVLDLQMRVHRLRVTDEIHAQYIDLGERLRKYEELGKEISEMDMHVPDRTNLLKQIEEEKSKILKYKTQKKYTKHPESGSASFYIA